MKNLREYKNTGVQYAYVLDAIDHDGGDAEKIRYFFANYEIEFNTAYNKKRYPNEAQRIGQYLQGLPSCINIAYWDQDIVEMGKAWGYCKNKRAELNFTQSWFSTLGSRLLKLKEVLLK